MTLKIAKGGWSHITIPVVLFGLLGYGAHAGLHQPVLAGILYAAGAIVTAFMVYFFRDPERLVTAQPREIVAGADGWVRRVETVPEPT
ncbi:MAG TPA: phosphatidylserine decarboxylase, partial [Kiritimatiellia bacterium]